MFGTERRVPRHSRVGAVGSISKSKVEFQKRPRWRTGVEARDTVGTFDVGVLVPGVLYQPSSSAQGAGRALRSVTAGQLILDNLLARSLPCTNGWPHITFFPGDKGTAPQIRPGMRVPFATQGVDRQCDRRPPGFAPGRKVGRTNPRSSFSEGLGAFATNKPKRQPHYRARLGLIVRTALCVALFATNRSRPSIAVSDA